MLRTLSVLGSVSAFNGGMSARSASRAAVSMSANLKDFSANKIDGSAVDFKSFLGKPTLVLNVASLWGTTVRDFTAMNALAEKYGDKINILAFPCNQFGHQTNEGNEEFLNTLKHVRPGNGFEPAKTITVMEKGDVNGANAQPLFKWMKSEIMIPTGGDDESCLVDTNNNGCADADALVLPRGSFGGTTLTLWSPVARSDIAWNFEKFLIDKDGKMVQRYHRYFLVGDIASDIDSLL